MMRRFFPLAQYFSPSFINDGDERIVILKSGQASILRKLLKSIRRFQFVGAQHGELYEPIDDSTWDAVRAEIDDMDYRLLGGSTMELASAILAVADAINSLSVCICKATSSFNGKTVRDVVDVVESSGIDIINYDPIPEETTPSQGPCLVANSYYGVIYELVTEKLIPALDAFSDFVLGVVEVSALLDILSGGIGIPATILFAIIAALINVFEDAVYSDLVNALLESQQELICAMYRGFINGNWDEEVLPAIDGMQTAPSNRQLLKLFFRGYVKKLIVTAIALGKVEAKTYIDCQACLQQGAPYLYLDGHYGSGDFVGDDVEGYYGRGWPNWLSTSVLILPAAQFRVVVDAFYAPDMFKIRQYKGSFPVNTWNFEDPTFPLDFTFNCDGDAFYFNFNSPIKIKSVAFYAL